jgi:predicted TIM-barrel fold metal-dependent hydrolase
LSSSSLDLSAIAFVDHHAHALTRRQPETPEDFRGHFTEAHSPLLARDHVGSSVQYRWAIRQLAAALDLEPAEDSLLAFRNARDIGEYAGLLVGKAGLGSILLDEGYPPSELAYASGEMQRMLGVAVGRILRIESLVERLIAKYADVVDAVAEFDATLEQARGSHAALKSIAAYRTGLAVERVPYTEAATAYLEVRTEFARHGSVRLSSKPLVDYFLYRALEFAANHALPVQFHTGYGDPDLDLLLANPLHLRSLLEDSAIAGAPVVLLHGSYPYTAEASFLAAVYPNVYLDLSFALPPIDGLELRRVLGTALGVAPASKILCSSDASAIPEHYFLGAVRARACLTDALGKMVDSQELGREEAIEIAHMLLRGNATRLYDLPLA